MRPLVSRTVAGAVAAGLLAACSSSPVSSGTGVGPSGPPAAATTSASPIPSDSRTSTTGAKKTPTPSPTEGATAPPGWLGTRVLEPGPTGFAPPQPTPPELFPRSIRTRDVLPPPTSETFTFTAEPVPDEVAARSTWHDGCPVTLEHLRHVTVTFIGFDGALHTGELLVNADAVDATRQIFRAMYETRFPLEQVTIASPADLDAPPTGDGNTTGAFVCRDARGSGSWSAHAYGRAIDINPFQNPYVRDTDQGRIVLPELATAYADRTLDLPGMLHDHDPIVAAIDAAGWTWGGHFTSFTDTMHASATGD